MKLTVEQASSKFKEIQEHLSKDLSSIRAGRANPKLVEDLEVVVYGQKMPIKQLANITVADPTLLIIQPWDKTALSEIKKAVESADIGINPLNDGASLRLPIPSLTEERRMEYVKIMKTKVEDARIAIRQVRKEILIGLEQQKKDKELSEDEFKAKEKELQKIVDEYNDEVEKIATEKETELMSI